MKKFIRLILPIIIIAVFATGVALISFSLPFFGDDYYYAAFVGRGGGYFVSENVFHYLNTNGRAFVHLLDELILACGMPVFALFNILQLTALVCLVGALATRRKKDFLMCAAAAAAMLALIPPAVGRQSLWWATGSLNYVFPLVLLCAFALLCLRDAARLKISVFTVILALFSSATSEQAAFATLCAALLTAVYVSFKLKRPKLMSFLLSASALAGFTFLYFAPGNAVRRGYYPEFYALSLPRRIISNLRRLSVTIFSYREAAGLLIISFAILFGIFCLVKNTCERRSHKVCIYIAGGVSLISAAVYAVYLIYPVRALALLSVVLLCLVFISAAVICFFRRSELGIAAVLAFPFAVAMQAGMLLSPEMGPRTVLCSLVIMLIPAARIAVLLFEEHYVMFAVTSLLCLSVLAGSVAGYIENVPCYRKNAAAVEEHLPIDRDDLVLHYPPNDLCRYTLPYDDPYHLYVFRQLYGINEATVIVWEP